MTTIEHTTEFIFRAVCNTEYSARSTAVLSGLSPDNRLVETVELTDRDFYIGVQYHPEFKSRPNKPHPLFKGFIKAALER